MSIRTKRNGELVIDESLRTVAQELVRQFNDELGYLDLAHVIFVRSEGAKLKKSGGNILGTCKYIKPEARIVNHWVVKHLNDLGLLELEQLYGIEDEILDIRYVITLNEAAILDISDDDEMSQRIETVVLHHELMHIAPDMEGTVQHDVQDFSWILDRYGVHWTAGSFDEREILQSANKVIEDFADKLKESGTKLSMTMPADSGYEEVD